MRETLKSSAAPPPEVIRPVAGRFAVGVFRLALPPTEEPACLPPAVPSLPEWERPKWEPSVPQAPLTPPSVIAAPEARRSSRCSWTASYWYEIGVGLLTLASGAAALYRLIWMGQP